jgi:hypothetical protein
LGCDDQGRADRQTGLAWDGTPADFDGDDRSFRRAGSRSQACGRKSRAKPSPAEVGPDGAAKPPIINRLAGALGAV